MSAAEWRAFASQGTRAGKLATVHADGRAQEFAARIDVPGELLVRVHIEKVIAFSGVAD